MTPNWAEENLQTIRTLMERSALYRRALAPIMVFVGIIGLSAAGTGLTTHMERGWNFFCLWVSAAIVAIAGALLIVRRQALKDKEAFWSPPTRRIAQAMAPALTAGLFLGLLITRFVDSDDIPRIITFLWMLFYGCAIHAAGFFMPRGMKFFGWIFVICPCGFLLVDYIYRRGLDVNAHLFMGFFFGVLHLAYGAYLYLTEKGKNAA